MTMVVSARGGRVTVEPATGRGVSELALSVR
jgi:hypothetical protein